MGATDAQNKQPSTNRRGCKRVSATAPNEECVPWLMLMALPRVGPEEAAAGAEEGQEFLNDAGRRERVPGSGRFLEEGRKENGPWSLSALYTNSPSPDASVLSTCIINAMLKGLLLFLYSPPNPTQTSPLSVCQHSHFHSTLKLSEANLKAEFSCSWQCQMDFYRAIKKSWQLLHSQEPPPSAFFQGCRRVVWSDRQPAQLPRALPWWVLQGPGSPLGQV